MGKAGDGVSVPVPVQGLGLVLRIRAITRETGKLVDASISLVLRLNRVI